MWRCVGWKRKGMFKKGVKGVVGLECDSDRITKAFRVALRGRV